MKPTKITLGDLAKFLRVTANAIEEEDSYEGSITYSCLDDNCDPGEFMVQAFVRVGNSQGQGGAMLIGDTSDQPKVRKVRRLAPKFKE